MEEDTGTAGGAHPLSGADTENSSQPSGGLPPGYVPYGNEPSSRELQVDDRGAIPSPEAATAGYKPLEAEEKEGADRLFPPGIDDPVQIGGDPEERETLNEELTR